MPGVAQSGPQATGAWMKEFGAWYFDLARRWDGTFHPSGTAGNAATTHTGGWDATGAYLLAYAMPLKKIWLTGKAPGQRPATRRRRGASNSSSTAAAGATRTATAPMTR